MPISASNAANAANFGAEGYDTARSCSAGVNGGASNQEQMMVEPHAPQIVISPEKQPPKGRTHSTSAAVLTERRNALRLSQIKQFCSITIDNSTAVNNQQYGIGILGFFGTVTIKNTQCNENETDGLVLAKNQNDPCLLSQEVPLNGDEAQFLDYADCTDRSSKAVPPQRSRSLATVH